MDRLYRLLCLLCLLTSEYSLETTNENDKPPFLFSVVIPIFNTQQYLRKTINSVIHQSIGFLDHIQLILVNDGSTDNSKLICLEYQKRYPKNIIYLECAHSGPSYARNLGLDFVEGEYLNCLDSDDYWDSQAFEHVFSFFERNADIDIVGCRIKLFEASNRFHILDYRFTQTQVVDLREKPDHFQISVATGFIRTSAIGMNTLNPNLTYGEDAHFMCRLLLHNPRIGLMREAVYYYRKRFQGQSLLQSEFDNPSYFHSTLQFFHNDIIKISMELYGHVPSFIQYILMYDVQWRLTTNINKYLPENEMKTYSETLKRILGSITDEIILQQRFLPLKLKVLAIEQKDPGIWKHFSSKNGDLFFRNESIKPFEHSDYITFTFVEARGNSLYLEGIDNCWISHSHYHYYARVNNRIIYPQYKHEPRFDYYSGLGLTVPGRLVQYEIPLPRGPFSISFFFQMGDNLIQMGIAGGKFSHIPPYPGYYVTNNCILIQKGKTLEGISYSEWKHCLCEIRYDLYLLLNKKGYLIWYRLLFWFLNGHFNGIWLLIDRTNQANDNAESFFRYLLSKKKLKILPLFAIESNTADYHRLRNERLGHVIPFGPKLFPLVILLADQLISSQISAIVQRPFKNDDFFMADLYHYKLVFLQHGVMLHDLSGWLHRFNQGIDLFVTSTQEEYNSVTHSKYGYGNDTVILSGLSRYDDLLRNNTQTKSKSIVFLPTWRQTLVKRVPNSHRTTYNPTFSNSTFFHFYNSLINSPKLLNVMRKHNYTGYLYLHPNFLPQWKDFKGNDRITIGTTVPHYTSLIRSASLLVTDYSSISFDFALLNKSIIYTQFDVHEFYSKHTVQKDYFSFETMGFGPVSYDLHSAIAEIIASIERDCVNPSLYISRIQAFFPKQDGHNSERILNHIMSNDIIHQQHHKKHSLTRSLAALILLLGYCTYQGIKLLLKTLTKYEHLASPNSC